MVFRPELLQASAMRAATERAATAVESLNIPASVCSPMIANLNSMGGRLSLSVRFAVHHLRIYTGIWGKGIYT
jgi:hypothetical protein